MQICNFCDVTLPLFGALPNAWSYTLQTVKTPSESRQSIGTLNAKNAVLDLAPPTLQNTGIFEVEYCKNGAS